MKKIITLALFCMGMLLVTNGTIAQDRQNMTDSATWQLVSNVKDRSKVTVQFYTNDGTLIYEETLLNTRLNINKRKTVRKLNALLTQVYTQWALNRTKRAETDLVAKLLD